DRRFDFDAIASDENSAGGPNKGEERRAELGVKAPHIDVSHHAPYVAALGPNVDASSVLAAPRFEFRARGTTGSCDGSQATLIVGWKRGCRPPIGVIQCRRREITGPADSTARNKVEIDLPDG